MKLLTIFLLALATAFLIYKREGHLEDGHKSAIVYYNLLIMSMVGIIVFYAVLT